MVLAMRNEPIKKVSVNEQVYQYLKDQIINDQLPPRTKINIPEEAALLGVSRMPVNAALARLQNEGYVIVQPQSGSYVRELTLEELEIIFRCRASMEREILLAYGSKLDTANLVDFQRQFKEVAACTEYSAETLWHNFDLDVAFHLFIVKDCPSIVLHDVLNIMDLTKRGRILQLRRVIQEKQLDHFYREITAHLEIIEQILSKDFIRAGDLLYEDIMNTWWGLQQEK